MIPNHAQFIQAVRDKNRIRVEFYSKPDSGVVDRVCAPLDYAPDSATPGGPNLYWVWDLSTDVPWNPLALASEQIVKVNILGTTFDPTSFGPTSALRSVRRGENPLSSATANVPPNVV